MVAKYKYMKHSTNQLTKILTGTVGVDSSNIFTYQIQIKA